VTNAIYTIEIGAWEDRRCKRKGIGRGGSKTGRGKKGILFAELLLAGG